MRHCNPHCDYDDNPNKRGGRILDSEWGYWLRYM